MLTSLRMTDLPTYIKSLQSFRIPAEAVQEVVVAIVFVVIIVVVLIAGGGCVIRDDGIVSGVLRSSGALRGDKLVEVAPSRFGKGHESHGIFLFIVTGPISDQANMRKKN